jgi:hypothetical protein
MLPILAAAARFVSRGICPQCDLEISHLGELPVHSAFQGKQSAAGPTFRNPPVVETALSIQFDPLEGFTNAHFGLYYKSVRERSASRLAVLGTEQGPDATVVVNLSGRGDKDMGTAIDWFGLADGPADGRVEGQEPQQ